MAANIDVDSLTTDLYEQPGHLMQRAQQIAVSMFYSAIGTHVTPVQYAVLRILQDHSDIDQNTLAKLCALDTSTTAALAVRLEERGLVERIVSPINRKFRLVRLTSAGRSLLYELVLAVHELCSLMVASLDPKERVFTSLLKKFVQSNNEQSRASYRRKPQMDRQ